MANEKEFQQKIRQLGSLVGELDQIPGGGSRVAARELVQLLMEVHGTALERIMELVFESGAGGGAMIDKLAQDQIVGNLLLLYSLHPDDLETRVAKALDEVRPRLRKFDCSVERVEVRDGVVELQAETRESGTWFARQECTANRGRSHLQHGPRSDLIDDSRPR